MACERAKPYCLNGKTPQSRAESDELSPVVHKHWRSSFHRLPYNSKRAQIAGYNHVVETHAIREASAGSQSRSASAGPKLPALGMRSDYWW